MKLEDVFTRHPLLAARGHDVRRAISYVERQSHLIELNCGLINMVSNLQFFKQPFLLIFDEFHFRHVPNPLEVVGYCSCKYGLVPTDVHVLGSDAIYQGLKVVVTSVFNLGLAQNVCAVISERNSTVQFEVLPGPVGRRPYAEEIADAA